MRVRRVNAVYAGGEERIVDGRVIVLSGLIGCIKVRTRACAVVVDNPSLSHLSPPYALSPFLPFFFTSCLPMLYQLGPIFRSKSYDFVMWYAWTNLVH